MQNYRLYVLRRQEMSAQGNMWRVCENIGTMTNLLNRITIKIRYL
jgi:hypothetical protein